MADVESVLRERETRGLRVPAMVRILVFVYLAIAFAALAPERGFVAIGIAICALLAGVNLVFLWQLSRGAHTRLIGYVGAIIDVMAIGAIVVSWYWVVGEGNLGPAFLSKAPLAVLTMGLVAINSLALRAAYPLIVTGGGLLIQGCVAVMIATDPRTRWAGGFADIFTADATSPLLILNVTVLIAIVGGSLAYVSHAAQRMVRQAVELEAENARIQHEQAQLLMEQKLAALAKLVAGVSHEVNTPLGALRAGIDTQRRAVERLRETAPRGEAAQARPLEVLADSVCLVDEAAARIDQTVHSLRRFARLDEGQRQRVDLHACLDSALEMLPVEARATPIERRYGQLPELECDPGQLNQAFLALISHACEGGEGVRIETAAAGERVEVRVDYSAGSPQGPELFEVSLASKDARIAARFDLPIAHSAVSQHGGSVEIAAHGDRWRLSVTLPCG